MMNWWGIVKVLNKGFWHRFYLLFWRSLWYLFQTLLDFHSSLQQTWAIRHPSSNLVSWFLLLLNWNFRNWFSPCIDRNFLCQLFIFFPKFLKFCLQFVNLFLKFLNFSLITHIFIFIIPHILHQSKSLLMPKWPYWLSIIPMIHEPIQSMRHRFKVLSRTQICDWEVPQKFLLMKCSASVVKWWFVFFKILFKRWVFTA